MIVVILIVTFSAAASAAEEPPEPPAPHLRAESPGIRELIQEVMDGSPTASGLIEQLQQSDVVVYVRFRTFAATDLDGRVALLAAVPGYRYLVVELACNRSRLAQLTTLAHELHHAVEIADTPAIVDVRSLSAHYSRIGIRTRTGPTSEVFETAAARETAAEARRELLGGARRSTRTTHDRD